MARRVLIVQPREALANVTARHVAAVGVEALVAADGERALDLLRHADFDAVLLDLTLPILDGWYVLAALGGGEHPPLVVYCDRSDAPRAVRLGADRCVHDRQAVAGTLAGADTLLDT